MKKLTKFQKRKRFFKRIKYTVILILFIYIFFSIYNVIANRIIATTNSVTKIKTQSIVNESLNRTLSSIIEEQNIELSNFYKVNLDENGEIKTIDVNTLLINEISNSLSDNLLQEFENNENLTFKIPLFSLFNSTFINDNGPMIKLSLLPIGNVNVTHETSFTSAGINQTNFQVWLNVECYIQMTNPVSEEIVVEKRRIPLVNTLINGNVPDYMPANSY